MPKGKKRQEPAVHIVLDTNALWTGRMDKLLSEEVSSFIKKEIASLDVDKTVYLPYVVVSERKRQMVAEAQRLYPHVQKLEALLGQTFVNGNLVESRIDAIITADIDSHDIRILGTEYNKVDWNDLLDKCLFRKAPFDAEVSDKGFKDAIILEGVEQLAKRIPPEPAKALLCIVCKDQRLREAITERKIGGDSLQLCGDLNELTTVLTAVRSNISQEVADSFVADAQNLFSESDEDSLILKWKIRDAVVERCKAKTADGYALTAGAIRESATSFTQKERTRIRFRTTVGVGVSAQKFEVRAVPIQPRAGLMTNPNAWSSAASTAELISASGFTSHSSRLADIPISAASAADPYGIRASAIETGFPPVPTVTNETFVVRHEGLWHVTVDWSATVTAESQLTNPKMDEISVGKVDWKTNDTRQVT